MAELAFGLEGKDKITGFTGKLVGRYNFLTGCNQWGLQPMVDAENKLTQPEFFDEGRIELTGNGIVIEMPDIKPEENFELGQEVIDIVTGFKGVLTAQSRYVGGVVYYSVSPKHKEGEEIKAGYSVEAGRIKVIGRGILASEVQGVTKGGPNRDMIRRVRR